MRELPVKDYGYHLPNYEKYSNETLSKRSNNYNLSGWILITISVLLVSYGGWITLLPGIILLLKKRKYAKIIAQRKYFAKETQCLYENPEKVKQQEESTFETNNKETATVLSPSKKAQRRTLDNMPIFKIEKFSSIKSTNQIFPLVILHVETTGLHKSRDKIVKISADKYGENFNLLESFSTFVNPNKPIPKEATKRNHITDEMVSNSPTFKLISEQLQNFITDANICGYFLPFHLSFLYKAGIDFSEKVKYYDVCEIVQSKVSESKIDDYQLRTVCKYYDVLYLGQNCDTIKNLFEEILTKYNKL